MSKQPVTKAKLVKAGLKLMARVQRLEKELAEAREEADVSQSAAEQQDQARRTEELKHSDELKLVLSRLDEIKSIVSAAAR